MFNKGDVMKKRIYEIIEVSKEDDTTSHIYDLVMMFTIFMSIIPLAFKQETKLFTTLDLITVIIFIIDYLLRWATADLKYDDPRFISYIKYPFSFMAIIDLLSILPSINIINKGFKALKTIRLIRTFRVLRIFKSFRYSKNIQLIIQVGKNSKNALIAVIYLAVGYIFVCALIIFNVEPDSFNTFFDAVYWATISLTTVGYGDIYPITTLGRIITMISFFMGIAIVALPAGIITAGYMKEIESDKI